MTSPTPSTAKVELSLSKNFFIWGNIILMAFIPWLLTQSMAGLAVGDSIFPAWFEISLLSLPAIALVTWLQWIQPISPFSLWLIAKPTEKLNEQERRALTLVSQKKNGWYVTGWIAIAVAIFMSAVFCKIYVDSPLSQVVAPFPDQLRFFGVLWAEVCFLLSNVLLQSGVSALRVRLAADSDLIALSPFEPEQIKDSFTHIGWRSPQFLTGSQTETEVIQELLDKNPDPDAENLDVVTETLPELGLENTVEQEESEIPEQVITKVDISDSPQEIIDNTDADCENKSDELMAFNVYVENILQDYLEEESPDNADETPAIAESQQSPKIPPQPKQPPKHLVEEFLVDKYLAKLEQLNNADKKPETDSIVPTTQPIEAKSVIDEFAGLDEVIDGKSIDVKIAPED